MLVFSAVFLLPSVLALATPWPAYKRESGTPVSVPISARYNLKKGFNIAEADRARAQPLIENAKKAAAAATANNVKPRQAQTPLQDKAVSYTISVGVGSPPTSYELLVDTGSSNTWVGANQPYVPTSTSVNTNQPVNVSYGSGSFSGTEYFDILTLASNLVFNQSIGVAQTSSGIPEDGILGIGPTDLTDGTVQGSGTIPTVVDNLYEQGLIPNNLISIFFQPTVGDSNNPTGTGELDFGAIDYEKVVGDVTYAPITSTSPANQYWGVDQSVTLSGTAILSTTAGIVDTGTTLVLLATDAFQAYQAAVGATPDETTGLLKITKDKWLTLPSVFFNIGGTDFELTADAQAWPQNLNSEIGGDSDSIYLIISDLGSPSGQGLDFINGQTFLQRFYSIYDTDSQQVGLSYTGYTFATTNVPLV